MQIVKKISEIREILSNLDKNNSKINLIPTMGNIHEGHLSLLKEANKYEGINVVSIFINPTQFNDIKDFENYPNTFDQDVSLLSKNNCEIKRITDNKNNILILYEYKFRIIKRFDQFYIFFS